ncbi:uncharacterized protein LOC129218676 [Uloborus diversus]|uniref:uncharacterized protein LOC129218676 n=1 Tax=Uloborus diversus TaxID=327109 RepID=UPI00240933D5|nr:uncharacterized protein LOC129218676 [Uloborus diversus]XP_054708971.1 uncharacterized protein LOC129218676 [Uloborus diversus]XP_054708972.1 uncharacterized protein LOC129218676 [Uloborus diversus]
MKLILTLVLFCLITLVREANGKLHKREANDESIGNANAYVDEVLENLRNEPWILSQLDPLDIPEVDEKNFRLENGQVKGLSSLYRHGNCTLAYNGEIVNVSAQVAVRDVIVEVKYAAKALFFWIKGHATVSVEDLAVRMDISGKDGRAKLDSFKVIHLGEYKIKKITGVSVVLNWLLKLIANGVAKKSRGKIIDAMENGVSKAVSDLLDKFQLPKFDNE